MSSRAKQVFLLLACFLLLGLASCGINSTQQAGFSNIPVGKGNDAEPGTNGLAKPQPEGHQESLLTVNGIVYAGSDNGQIYAFDAQSGKILWQRKQKANSLRAIVGGIIYSLNQEANTLCALDATNGATLWQRSLAQPIDNMQVAQGIVYVNTGNAAFPAILYALRASDGVLLWQDNRPPNTLDTLNISNGRVYDAPLYEASDGTHKPQTITVLDAASGRVLWHLTIPTRDGFVRGGIAELNGTVYFSTNHGSVYAVQSSTGQVIWHTSQSASGLADQAITQLTPVISNGLVFAGSTQDLFAYRASDGKQIWQYAAHTFNDPPVGLQPLVENGVVYFVASAISGPLIALRASDGKTLWQKPAQTAPDGLVLANGLLINLVGSLTIWRASDGSQVWERNTDNGEGPPGPGSPVVIGGDNIYLGGGNGLMQALRLNDGAQLWHYQIQELPVQEPPVYSAFITFSRSTSYDRAIQIVSDLGLKTYVICRFTWISEDEKNDFQSGHTLMVLANTNSAPLWFNRLQDMPEVAQIQPSGTFSCPLERSTPDSIQRLNENQAGVYLQISFAGSVTYTSAWENLNALGFRLADPCYEKARAQGEKPTWYPMGEEDSFGQTHTLVVATTIFNATIWQQQLRTIPGVGKITSFAGTCS